jgi:hypothetical protein
MPLLLLLLLLPIVLEWSWWRKRHERHRKCVPFVFAFVFTARWWMLSAGHLS